MDLSSYFKDEPLAIIGNFPYNISSQIFFRILEDRERVVSAVVMIQKEVADRIIAGPGSKTYGILSVLLQTWYDMEYLFTVSPGVFNPPPKVRSAVIRLSRNQRQDVGNMWVFDPNPPAGGTAATHLRIVYKATWSESEYHYDPNVRAWRRYDVGQPLIDSTASKSTKDDSRSASGSIPSSVTPRDSRSLVMTAGTLTRLAQATKPASSNRAASSSSVNGTRLTMLGSST